ncbi:MAG: hypothetical protein IPG23_25325 [Burkholderiales bacterium]|nr:hypothetical protein [Burkholderiales bacterium]
MFTVNPNTLLMAKDGQSMVSCIPRIATTNTSDKANAQRRRIASGDLNNWYHTMYDIGAE